MKKDIATKYDIDKLVTRFYEQLQADANIAPYFAHISPAGWEHLLCVAKAFWENVVFFTGNYEGNPMDSHKKLHEKIPLQPAHFKKWLHLFTTTVDAMYRGPKAELIKQRAHSIATVMQIKILTGNAQPLR